MSQKPISLLSVAILGACITLTGCITEEEKRGYAIEFAKLDALKPGVSTSDDVLATLGSPSTRSNFGAEKWYYINTTLETAALSKPEMVGQDTLVVTFNEGGTLQSIDRTSGEDSRNIAFAEDKTRTEGNSFTVMEQLLGNLGRFNNPQGTKAGKIRGPQGDL